MANSAERETLRKVLNFDRYNSHRIPDDFRARVTRHSHPYAFYSKPIEKSENDQREYELIRLDNGLEIMLVSDADADRAAACLSVRAGSMHDPVDLPGLAHYCEHLLFCGSKKYPQENDYSEFISAHGGNCNAFTALEFTNFNLDIQPKYIGGALDRLAHILIAPLFEASVCDRELHAVDSEFKAHVQQDGWREDAIRSFLSRPDHPARKFNIGSLDTLKTQPEKKGIDTRAALIDFYKQYYSANVMRLCVVSNQSLTTLIEICAGLFSDVPNSNREPTIWLGNPIPNDQLLTQTFIKRIRERDVLSLVFPLSEQSGNFQTSPAIFIGNLIGHESKGSLLSFFKAKDWATGICAGLECSATGWSSAAITVNLTNAGKSRTHDIITAIFSYLKMLKEAPSLELQFLEYAAMAKIHFRFREVGESSDTADELAQMMHEPYESSSKVISQSAIADVYDAKIIKETLDQFSAANFQVLYSSLDEVQGVDYTGKEPYFGVEFGQGQLTTQLLSDCASPPFIPALSLPAPNHFIPYGLKHIEGEIENKDPIILQESDGMKIWYKRDAIFKVPKSTFFFVFRNELATESCRTALSIRLFTDILEDSINENAYQCAEAGIGFSLDHDELGISLLVEGYSPGLRSLIRDIGHALANLTVDEPTFLRLKESAMKSLRNWSKSNAIAKASNLLGRVLSPICYSPEERLAEFATLTSEEVLASGKKLLESIFVEAYVHGDLSPEHATGAVQDLKDCLGYQNYKDPEKNYKLSVKPGTNAVINDWAENADEVNHAIINYYSGCFTENREATMTLSMIVQCLQERCFDELRTRKQLGYSVGMGQKTGGGVTGIIIEITSETLPSQLDKAIDQFLQESLSFLKEMTPEKYSDNRTSLADCLVEQFKTMDEEAGYNWNAIDSGRLAFRLFDEDAERVRKIEKPQVIELFKRVCLDQATRGKLSIQVRSRKSTTLLEDLEISSEASPITDYALFQSQSCIRPPPVVPYVTVDV